MINKDNKQITYDGSGLYLYFSFLIFLFLLVQSILPLNNPGLFLNYALPSYVSELEVPTQIVLPDHISVEVGQSKTLSVQVQGGTSVDNNFLFTTDDSSKARAFFDNNRAFVVQGVSTGETQIRVSSFRNPNVSAVCRITIEDATPTLVTFSSTVGSEMHLGASGNILTSFTPYYSKAPVSFSSSDSSVVTIDSFGHIFSKSVGTAVLSASSSGTIKSFVVKVTSDPFVPSKASINLLPSLTLGTTVDWSISYERPSDSVAFSSCSVMGDGFFKVYGTSIVPTKAGKAQFSLIDMSGSSIAIASASISHPVLPDEGLHDFYLGVGLGSSFSANEHYNISIDPKEYVKICRKWYSKSVNDPLFVFDVDFSFDSSIVYVSPDGVVYLKDKKIKTKATIIATYFNGEDQTSRTMSVSFERTYPDGYGQKHLAANLSFFAKFCFLPFLLSFCLLSFFSQRDCSLKKRRFSIVFFILVLLFGLDALLDFYCKRQSAFEIKGTLLSCVFAFFPFLGRLLKKNPKKHL